MKRRWAPETRYRLRRNRLSLMNDLIDLMFQESKDLFCCSLFLYEFICLILSFLPSLAFGSGMEGLELHFFDDSDSTRVTQKVTRSNPVLNVAYI